MENSLNSILILDPTTTSDGLSPLEENIIDLMCGERSTTGRILKPYFHIALRRLLEPQRTQRLIRHIDALFLQLEWKAQHPAPLLLARNESSQESAHARG